MRGDGVEYSLRQRRTLWLYTFVCPAIDKFVRIVNELGRPEELFDNPPDALDRYVGSSILSRIRKYNSESYIDALLERLRARGVDFVCRGDAEYPARLEEAPGISAPELLFVRGDRNLNVDSAIGVVGTRDCSSNGTRIARSFACDFARAGAQVVSGMALGIDAAAIEGVLDGGGRAIGVMGCGVDVPYPADNQVLVRRMLENGGTLISEYMPGMHANRIYFPMRNRIIAGMTRGTLVVEAPAKSGALNTVSHALNMGREVFVVPGSILDANYAGSNELLRDGAAPALSSFDVLEPLGIVELSARGSYSALQAEDAPAQPPAREVPPKPRKATARSKGASKAKSNAPKGAPKAKSNAPKGKPAPASGAEPPAPRRELPELNPDERQVVNLLIEREHSFDEMISQTDFDAAKLNSLLTMLKIKRIIYETTGKHFRLDDSLR